MAVTEAAGHLHRLAATGEPWLNLLRELRWTVTDVRYACRMAAERGYPLAPRFAPFAPRPERPGPG